MNTINRLINRGLWIFGPAALAILCALAANSGLHDDGIYIGHPIQRVVYMQGAQDARLAELAASIPMNQFARK